MHTARGWIQTDECALKQCHVCYVEQIHSDTHLIVSARPLSNPRPAGTKSRCVFAYPRAMPLHLSERPLTAPHDTRSATSPLRQPYLFRSAARTHSEPVPHSGPCHGLAGLIVIDDSLADQSGEGSAHATNAHVTCRLRHLLPAPMPQRNVRIQCEQRLDVQSRGVGPEGSRIGASL